MNVVFRTDASTQIGSGHVMRCLTLAEGLRERGAEVVFVCRELPGNLNAMIVDKGFVLCCLPAPDNRQTGLDWCRHAAWLGVDWRQDAEETRACLPKAEEAIDVLVVDHYALDDQWEARMRLFCNTIMVVDDLADRQHDCDLLLDQNLYPEFKSRYEDLVPQNCRVMIGPDYALLRPEFFEARRQMRPCHGEVRRLLVFYGGDPTNETRKALEAIQQSELKDVDVDVVVGATNPAREHIEAFCRDFQNIHFHFQVGNMAALMASADLMLCAGGTTTWERCSLGLPGLVTATAENQVAVAENSALAGLSFYLGPSADVTSKRIANALEVLMAAPQCLQMYAANALAAVDARGLQRMAGLLLPPNVTVRPAVMDDCDSIYRWRNAEETRRYIFDQETIPYNVHCGWFRTAIESPDRILLIGEMDGRPVGVVRFDITVETARISVYLVPGEQGRGIGSRLIQQGSRWLRQHYPAVKMINAEILKENSGSLKAFEHAGYTEHHRIYKKAQQ